MKKILATILVLAMLLSLAAGCGSSAASAPAQSADPVESAVSEAEAPEIKEEVSAEEASVVPEEVSAEEESTPVVEHRILFPGSEKAQLDYSNEYTLPISEGGETLTWMRTALNLMGPLGELGLSNLQALDAIQELQARTGITIEYSEIDFWTAQEKMNIAIASGDYPAIMSNLLYTGGNTAAYNDDVIVNLTDLLPEYSPNYQYMIDSNPQVAGIFRNDGLVLCYQSPYDSFVQNQGMVIRSDWLEELKLDCPTTYEEMFETLCAFRDNYAGITPLYFNSQCTINGLTVGYDVAAFNADGSSNSLPYYVEDGKVHCTLLEDSYKEYLMEMNRWYNEGLIAKDFATVAYNPMGGVLGELTANGMVGAWCTSGEGVNNITSPVVPVPNLMTEEGGTDHQTSMSLLTDSDNTFVTTCCENVETAMQFLDYLYSEDGILFYNYGFEGIDYELDADGRPQYTDAVINNEYGVDVPNMLRIRRPYTLCSSMMLLYATADFNTELKNSCWEVWTSNMDGAHFIPTNVTMNTDEAETAAYYGTDIITYAVQMIPQFISGDVGFDQWDSFVAQLKQMSIEACIQAEQSAYDRCMG